jgi:hypothetical protein
MARSTRERFFMVGVAAAVGLWALDHFALEPYLEARDEIALRHDAARDEEMKVERLRRDERRMRRAWDQMRAAGIESAPSEVEGRVLHAMNAWAQSAGVAHLSLRQSRVNREHGFVQVIVHAGGTGPAAAVAKLLWSVESTTNIPMRVDELRLTPAKEGVDDLQIDLTVSTLCAAPAPEAKPDAARASVAAAAAAPGKVRAGEDRP